MDVIINEHPCVFGNEIYHFVLLLGLGVVFALEISHIYEIMITSFEDRHLFRFILIILDHVLHDDLFAGLSKIK